MSDSQEIRVRDLLGRPDPAPTADQIAKIVAGWDFTEASDV